MEKDTILLTGATGALGSMLLPRLLGKGYHVTCLVRGNSRAHAQDRIRALVGRHPLVKVIRGDITETRCGIADIDREHLFGTVKYMFHCAASISFQDKTATHDANVNGVHHMLELADILDAQQIIHVSTAYVAGDARFFSEAESASPISFRPRNYYEETKQLGETMVRAWGMKRDQRRFTIFRPSILIGCEDGTSPTFDAFYGYFKPIHRVSAGLRERARKRGLLPHDVSVDNEWIDMPLVLEASPDATLNVVPIDWCASMMVQLLEVQSRDDVYHLVNQNPPLVRWVIDTSLRYLKIRGIRIVDSSTAKRELLAEQSPLVRRLQAQVDQVLNQYLPYTKQEISFAMANSQRALGKRFEHQRPFDASFIGELLEYAVNTNWGSQVPVLEPAQ